MYFSRLNTNPYKLPAMKKLYFLSLLTLNFWVAYTQSVGINTDASLPNASAMLDVSSNTKGLLIPRMSTAERKAIVTPAAGLLVFDLDKSTIYLFDGQKWQAMLFTSSDGANPPIARFASDGSPGNKFGTSVSISGDFAVIGAPLDDINTKTDQGSAYIFVRQGGLWTEQVKLTAVDGAAGDNFGNSVSISVDYAIVGAPKGSGAWSLQGAAYIFVRSGNTWIQQAKLNSTDGVIGETFGTSVCINGDYAVIGNPNARVVYASQGAAYIFTRSGIGWAQQAKLTYVGGQFNDFFGYSVSISGDYVIIGAPYFDWFFTNQGAAFIFLRTGTTWAHQVRINANDGAAEDYFGVSINIEGDYAIIGAPNDDGTYTDQGAAYIYLRNGTTWNQQQKLTAPDPQLNANYGNSVNVSGGYAVIGSIYESGGINPYHSREGAAYIYRRTGTYWDIIRVAKDGSGQTLGFFGSGVGVSGFNYIIGAAGKNGAIGEVSFLNME